MSNLEEEALSRVDQMVAMTDGFTSADIAAAMKEVQLESATKAIKEREEQEGGGEDTALSFEVGWQDIRQGLQTFQRSFQKEEVAALKRHYQAFRTGKAPDIQKQRLISK